MIDVNEAIDVANKHFNIWNGHLFEVTAINIMTLPIFFLTVFELFRFFNKFRNGSRNWKMMPFDYKVEQSILLLGLFGMLLVPGYCFTAFISYIF